MRRPAATASSPWLLVACATVWRSACIATNCIAAWRSKYARMGWPSRSTSSSSTAHGSRRSRTTSRMRSAIRSSVPSVSRSWKSTSTSRGSTSAGVAAAEIPSLTGAATMPITECDGRLFREALLGSLAWLTVNRDEVDSLNVFPVPDGDTGTNMLLTLQSAVEDIRDVDDADLSRTARRASHGALMGARGNSAVILSPILRGISVLIGTQTSARPATQRARPKAVEAPAAGWGYCTEFIINGDGLAVDDVRAEIQRHGESALVVGDESAIKVHVHTQEPAVVISYASGVGRLSRLKVDDMSSQHHRLQGDSIRRPASTKHLALVAVASGDGFRRILESLGVDSVVGGGPTVNPSTEDILAAVESVPSDDVLLLPNNGNVVMTAQQVAELSRKRVRVVPSRSLPQGIAALFAFDFSADLEANASAMSHALSQVQTIEVTRAVRATEVDGLKIAENDVIGLLNDRIVVAGETPDKVVKDVLTRIDAAKVGTVTIHAGSDSIEAEREALVNAIANEFPTASVELQAGEQPLYPYIVAVE